MTSQLAHYGNVKCIISAAKNSEKNGFFFATSVVEMNLSTILQRTENLLSLY
jgi:hypothetical protein